MVTQLQRMLKHLATFYDQCHKLLEGQRFFPIEVDLAQGAFTYKSVGELPEVNINQSLTQKSDSYFQLLSPFAVSRR